jgi:hypothetical protein
MSKPVAYGGLAARWCKIRNINVLVSGLEIAFYSEGLKNRIVRFVLKCMNNTLAIDIIPIDIIKSFIVINPPLW